MCQKVKEIHARVTEFCSGNEMRTSGRGTDGHPRRRQYPPPPLRRAGFEFDKLKIFRAYPYLKPHILFCSNGLAIWHGVSDIRDIKVNHGR